MAKKKILIPYIVFMVVFIAYLFTANLIVENVHSDEQKLSAIKFSSIPSNQQPTVSVDCVYSGGVTEDFFVSGWAFCETSNDNSSKEINVVLKDINSDNAYISRANAQRREDVYGVFRDIKNIYGVMNGVYSKFPTYTMPTGVYEIFINVVENATDYGIVSTNRFFKKTAFNFYEVDSQGNDIIQPENEEVTKTELVDITVEQKEPAGNSWIDSVTRTSDSTISISGWASYSAETNASQTIYIGLTDSSGFTTFYSTVPVERQDVATAFSDSSYASCGFSADIIIGDVSESYTITLAAGVDGKYYPIIANGVTSYSEETTPAEAESDSTIETETTQLQDIVITDIETQAQGQAWVDVLEVCDDGVDISGWGTLSPEANEQQVLYVGLTDSAGNVKYYLTEKVERKDVAESFNDPSYINCGYHVNISGIDSAEKYTVSVVAFAGEKYYNLSMNGETSFPQSSEEATAEAESIDN